MYGSAPYQSGPGASSGFLAWTGAGCSGGASSNANWLTVGTPGTAGTINTIPFSIQENTGSSNRSATVTFTGVNSYSTTMTVTQDAAGVARPSIISLSPGTGNLSSQQSEEIMKIFQELNGEGITIVMVTHEPDIAEYTTRQVVFRDGRLVRDDPVTHPRDAQAEWAVLATQNPDEDF